MTGGWPKTIWTEARQIGELLRWPGRPGDDAAPDRYFAALRADDRAHDAALFLGQALPRYEAVLWAAEVAAPRGADGEGDVIAAVRAWLRDPSDARRRTAMASIAGYRKPSAAQHCAMAVFMSGGSLTPEGKPPQPPPRDAAGRFAAVAVLMATVDADGNAEERVSALNRALDLGEKLARNGQEGTP